jgi:hypothetical protein
MLCKKKKCTFSARSPQAITGLLTSYHPLDPLLLLLGDETKPLNIPKPTGKPTARLKVRKQD